MYKIFYIVLLAFPLANYAQTNDNLPIASPLTRGYSNNFFTTIGKEAEKKVSNLGAFLVWQHDSLLCENYFHGFDGSSIFNIKSASKSILSAIAGAAQARGYLPDLNTHVLDVLPEYRVNRHTKKIWFAEDNVVDDSLINSLTLRDLLTMQTGLDWDDFGSICQAFVSSYDPVRFTLDVPFSDNYEQGKDFNYCSGGTHVFAVALAKLVKADLWQFADSTIFKPTGMKLQRWNTDAMGRYIGGCDMYFTAQDMMRFGILYLNKGKINDKQVLPEKWVDESTNEQAELKYWDVLPNADGYGYFWWRRKSNGRQVYVASGVCGQLICVIPDLDMVVVTACSCGENNGRKEIRKLHLIMDKITSAANRIKK